MKKYMFLFIVGALCMGFITQSTDDKKSEATTKGINFESISFDEAIKKAKEEGKLVFIDCYTDWCGPCKRMAKTTFMDAKLGEYFEKNFVSIKVEMEKDAEGPELARKFRIRAYPTLAFVDGDGNLIQTFIGMRNVEQMKDIAEIVLSSKES